MVTTHTTPHLWTPRLSDTIRASHYATGKCPILVALNREALSTSNLGLQVVYDFDVLAPLNSATPIKDTSGLAFSFSGRNGLPALRLPLFDLDISDSQVSTSASEKRTDTLVIANAYRSIDGGPGDLPNLARNLTFTDISNEKKLNGLFRKAVALYVFEPTLAMLQARYFGCEVFALANEHSMSAPPLVVDLFGQDGLRWHPDARDCAASFSPLSHPWQENFKARYHQFFEGWEADLARFVQQTQEAATEYPSDLAWPEEVVLALPVADETPPQSALRADKIKLHRVNKQYAQWRQRSSLREIDGEIYGEYVASGKLPSISAMVYHAEGDGGALADTLDSLASSFLQPCDLTIVSTHASPFQQENNDALTWIEHRAGTSQALDGLTQLRGTWVLVVKAGTLLEPNAILEFAIAAMRTTATLIYADDDVISDEGFKYPHFKSSGNVEWLRSTNYLGDAVLVSTRSWLTHPEHGSFEGAYAFALRAIEDKGASALQHIDSVLVHGRGELSDQLLQSERTLLQHHLSRLKLKAHLSTTNQQGVYTISYEPSNSSAVSLVVPTQTQTGYLDCLLASLQTFTATQLAEIILVTDSEYVERVSRVVSGRSQLPNVRVVGVDNSPYCHAKALNAGATAATSPLLLIADDDTEAVHKNWLEPLIGQLNQADVGCVGPRIIKPGKPDPKLQFGPLMLGPGGLAMPYNGEQANVLEGGVYGRLQGAQDVGATAPHFFVVRKELHTVLGGFRESGCGLFNTVLDFQLRANQLGMRHVWTPAVSVAHQGGKTLEDKHRLPEESLKLQQQAFAERQYMLSTWAQALGNDRFYNRNLSIARPFDLEQDIVVDWHPTRHERPRALALPLSSGSGQYRVVEPLNALQNAGKAQSCVVFPPSRDVTRVPTSVELIRAGMDRLIIQNAISDLQLSRLEEYKKQIPDLFVVQMMDDLFGNLPDKHYLKGFHKREGDARIRRSLELSDRLIVTTQPLKDFYQDYIADVQVIPNALVENTWFDLPVTPRPRNGKLRVGWAGAQQHLGDLDMIQTVVAALADQVDWIFMGMCPPSIKPHVKEVHPFVSISQYPQTLANLDLDIAIAPLEDNPFNACKSNLRLLEYGAMGWPVVCSDVYPYRSDDPPVFRVGTEPDEWLAALNQLIDNEELRRHQGTMLNNWVKTKFALSIHTESWYKGIFETTKNQM